MFGNPLTIKISLIENARSIKPNISNSIPGTRGERILEEPIQWIVNFDTTNNYQIIIGEKSIIARAYRYYLPKTPITDAVIKIK